MIYERRGSWNKEKVEQRIEALLPLTNFACIKAKDEALYSAIRRLHLVDFVRDMIRQNGGRVNESIKDYPWERVIEIHDACGSWKEFFENYKPAWRSATAMGRMVELRNRGLALRKKRDFDQAKALIESARTRVEVMHHHNLFKKHLGDDWQKYLPDSLREIRDNWELQFEASKYSTRSAFKFESPRHYSCAQSRGLLDSVCAHMGPAPCNRSYPEIQLFEYVKQLAPDAEANVWLFGHIRSSVDIYVPSAKLAIEYNGLKWHSERVKGDKARMMHLSRQEAAATLGIRLIHIWGHDPLPVVRSLVKNLLGKSERRLQARKGEVKLAEPTQASDFLDRNHLQGYGVPRKRRMDLGLFIDGMLESVMSFSPAEFRNGEDADWNLVRFASSLDTSIAGAAGKLFARRPTGSIVSYSDTRIFSGKLYQNLGFEKYAASSPDYFYEKEGVFHPKRSGSHRTMRRIFSDYDPCIPEREQMQAHNFYRVWDCGKVKWTLYDL